ncbi:hypothetical protein BGZ72_008642 [Mortierella alpina]|nr:hypothetical protein BGZ72_008642 [Mortierella alpina]
MLSIRTLAVMALVAVVATVSAVPAANRVEPLAALPTNMQDYRWCTTAKTAIACYNLCGGDNGGNYASIRAIATMAFIAVIATVSAAPAAELLEAVAQSSDIPDGYKFCTTRPVDYMACWNYCGRKGYWYLDPKCCCP